MKMQSVWHCIEPKGLPFIRRGTFAPASHLSGGGLKGREHSCQDGEQLAGLTLNMRSSLASSTSAGKFLTYRLFSRALPSSTLSDAETCEAVFPPLNLGLATITCQLEACHGQSSAQESRHCK